MAFRLMDVVKLEVELEHKKDKEIVEIELSWKTEGSVEEEEEETAGTAVGKAGETDTETHEPRSIRKMILPLTGLAVAGGLIFGLVKGMRSKGKVRSALGKSKEEAKRISEQGNRLIEEGELRSKKE